jgi:hypothetical protein
MALLMVVLLRALAHLCTTQRSQCTHATVRKRARVQGKSARVQRRVRALCEPRSLTRIASGTPHTCGTHRQRSAISEREECSMRAVTRIGHAPHLALQRERPIVHKARARLQRTQCSYRQCDECAQCMESARECGHRVSRGGSLHRDRGAG